MKDLPRSLALLLKVLKRESDESETRHPEIELLWQRLELIEPKELAKAFYQLETVQKFPYLLRDQSFHSREDTEIYFSRGLKFEVQSIYLHLAHHLKERSEGSQDLMKAMFELFSETIKSLPQVPHLTSNN